MHATGPFSVTSHLYFLQLNVYKLVFWHVLQMRLCTPVYCYVEVKGDSKDVHSITLNLRTYIWAILSLSSVQSLSLSKALQPHELQHARPPCPSPTPGVQSNSCPSSRWYLPAISFSVVPFSSCPQSLPASEYFFQWVNSSHEVTKVLEFQL